MNQIKRSLAIILCLTCGTFTAFAQDLNDDSIYIQGNPENAYTLLSGKQWTTDEMTFYQYFLMSSSQDVFLLMIKHEGALSFMKNDRMILGKYAEKETTASILFDNGYTATVNVLIQDTTDPDYAENTASITYVIDPYSGNTNEIKKKNALAFVNYNITRITVDGISTSIKSSDIKSATFISNLVYQYSLIEEGKKEKKSLTPYSVQQNLTLVNMLSKPMGCVSSDLLYDPVNAIRANLERAFHVEVDDNAHSISVTAYENDEICENMNYRGLKFSRFRIYDGDGYPRRVLYGFDLKKRDNNQLLPVLNQIASDFRSLGIPMTVQPPSDTSYGTHAKKDGIEYTLYAQDYNVMWDITVEIRM